jgi:hypothetical protein
MFQLSSNFKHKPEGPLSQRRAQIGRWLKECTLAAEVNILYRNRKELVKIARVEKS